MIRRIQGIVVGVLLTLAPAMAGDVFITQSPDPTGSSADHVTGNQGPAYIGQLPLTARPQSTRQQTPAPFVKKLFLEQAVADIDSDENPELAIAPYEDAAPRLPDTGQGSEVSLVDPAHTAAFPSIAGGPAGG